MKSHLLAITLSLCTTLALGWGAEGHRVTGLMADDMLTPKARIAVGQLLDGGALVDAVLFADIYREVLKREVPGSDKWHYDNIPVCGKLAEKYCEDGHCASAQIPKQFAILADKSKTKDERALALKFLIHMVGDIHQPLHAADDYDLGGGRKTIFMPSGTVPRNLHIAWDVDLVKLLIRGMSETDFAKQLIKDHQKDFGRWMRGSPVSWIMDSHGISKRLAYGKLPGFTCGEADANGKQMGVYEGKPWGDTAVMLTEDYVKGAVGVLPVLLARAGARMGGLLNSALDPEGALPQQSKTQLPTEAVSAAPVAPKTESLREALSRTAPVDKPATK